MKEELEAKYVPPHLVLVSWTIDTNILKAISLQRSMLKSSINSSTDAVFSIRGSSNSF